MSYLPKVQRSEPRYGLTLGLSLTGLLCMGPAFGVHAQTNNFQSAAPGFGDAGLEVEADEPLGLFDVADGEVDDSAVQMDSFGKIDLAVKDLEIAKVLQLLSIQSQKNIVLSRNVAGTVSADLYGVTFHEALDAILDPNGFGYEEKGNFVFVYTQDELAERELANRKTVTKVLHLNYMNGSDAKTIAESMLSDNGKVAFSAETDGGFQASIGDGGSNSYALGDTIVVTDYEENVQEIESLIQELDLRPQQVLIEATILQASLTEANAFGVDFSVFANLSSFDFANPLNAIDALAGGGGPEGDSGGGVQSTVGNTAAGAGGVKVGYVGSDAAVFLRALDRVTDTTVVAKPNVLVLNRQKADLLVGERLGYLSTTVTETSETQTVEFLDVGTQLSVRPFISREGTIRLELRPSISDGRVTTENGFVIPNEVTQELITNVIVEDGQTVVIGGLFKEATTIGRSQVPGLGDLPVLGNAFKGQDDRLDRDEVIFLIKTSVMESSQLALMGNEAERTVLNNRIGAREGLLPWSTDKMVSSHLLKAKKALAAGDRDKALWHTDLALHLSPTSADALALKQQITGEAIAYHDRNQLQGLLDTAIDSDIEAMAPVAGPVEVAETAEPVLAEGDDPVEVAEATETPEVPVTDQVKVETVEVVEAEPVAEPAATDVEFVEAEVEAEAVTDEDLDWVFETETESSDPAQAAEVEVATQAVDGSVAGTASDAQADAEWEFGFDREPDGSNEVNDAPATAAAPAADPASTPGSAEVAEGEGDFDVELFFDDPSTDLAEEAPGSAPADTETPADEDPVFNYYEQLMSEVETE